MPDIHFYLVEHDRYYDDLGSSIYDRFLINYLNEVEETISGRFKDDFRILDTNPWWACSCDLMYAVDWDLC